MARWQRNARFVIAVFAVIFAVFVARQLKRRDAPTGAHPVPRADPGAIVETTGGKMMRFTGNRQDVVLKFQTQLLYPDGTSKLSGVDLVTDERNGEREFT